VPHTDPKRVFMNPRCLTDNKNAINDPSEAIKLTLTTGNALLQIYYRGCRLVKIITDLMHTMLMGTTSAVRNVTNHDKEIYAGHEARGLRQKCKLRQVGKDVYLHTNISTVKGATSVQETGRFRYEKLTRTTGKSKGGITISQCKIDEHLSTLPVYLFTSVKTLMLEMSRERSLHIYKVDPICDSIQFQRPTT